LARHGKPEIFNTDQGSQFTGAAFTGVLANNDIAISMDGKGAWRDNVFVERLWRSVKYEEVYLHAYDSVSEARASIGSYAQFGCRWHPRYEPTSTFEIVPADRHHGCQLEETETSVRRRFLGSSSDKSVLACICQ
jgi:transposase InsO family protein